MFPIRDSYIDKPEVDCRFRAGSRSTGSQGLKELRFALMNTTDCPYIGGPHGELRPMTLDAYT